MILSCRNARCQKAVRFSASAFLRRLQAFRQKGQWSGEQKVQSCPGQHVPGGQNYIDPLMSEAGLSRSFRM